MIIQLTAEEVTRIVIKHLNNNIAGIDGVDFHSGFGYIDGKITMVVALEQDLPSNLFDSEDDSEESEEEENNDQNGSNEPKAPKAKGTGKRTRRTRAQIEEDERREREAAKKEADQPVVAPVETQTEVPADQTPPFVVDEPAPTPVTEAVEAKSDENLFAADPAVAEPVKEDPVETDAALFDTGATNNPFAEPGDAVAESSDTNLFSVDSNTDSEFQKPVEDNTQVFDLFK